MSWPDGVPKKKKGISTANAAPQIASRGTQRSDNAGGPAIPETFGGYAGSIVFPRFAPGIQFARCSTIETQIENISVYTFNPNLILLKPSGNGFPLAYSQRVEQTKIGEPAPETGFGFFDSLDGCHRRSLSLPRSLYRPALQREILPEISAINLPREAFLIPSHNNDLDLLRREDATRRLRLLECVGDGVRKESRPVAEKCRVAKAQAASLPYRRQVLATARRVQTE